jgi:hypothetical protein
VWHREKGAGGKGGSAHAKAGKGGQCGTERERRGKENARTRVPMCVNMDKERTRRKSVYVCVCVKEETLPRFED